MQVGTCACVTNFFSFSFFASHDSLSLSLSVRSLVQIGFVNNFFFFLFLFLLDMILVMHFFFFWEPHTSKKNKFP